MDLFIPKNIVNVENKKGCLVRHSIGNDVQRKEKINCFYFSSKLEIVRFTLELDLSLCTQIGSTEQKTLV
jgi:hypothetical protein